MRKAQIMENTRLERLLRDILESDVGKRKGEVEDLDLKYIFSR